MKLGLRWLDHGIPMVYTPWYYHGKPMVVPTKIVAVIFEKQNH